MAFDCHVFHAYSNALVLWETCVRMFHVSLNEHSTSFFLYPVQLFPAQQKREEEEPIYTLSVCVSMRRECESSVAMLCLCFSFSCFSNRNKLNTLPISLHFFISIITCSFFLFDCVCLYFISALIRKFGDFVHSGVHRRAFSLYI